MTDWEHVVRTHGPLVWQTAWRLRGHESDAADCFQETLVSALEATRVQQVQDWPSFLIKLATARSIDRLRRRAREHKRWETRPAVGGKETAIERPAAEAGPPAAAEQAEEARLVQVAAASLPDKHRAVLELRFFAGASLDEIATLHGCLLGTVKSRLHHGLEKLRRAKIGVNLVAASGASPVSET